MCWLKRREVGAIVGPIDGIPGMGKAIRHTGLASHLPDGANRVYAEAGDRVGLARILHTMAEVPLNQRT